MTPWALAILDMIILSLFSSSQIDPSISIRACSVVIDLVFIALRNGAAVWVIVLSPVFVLENRF